ncbi:MAG TPA: metalloregulator ArsR/SmtB family transcription factor [Rhodobacteraceae bacterium]|nr:metalloregulator ArsR/SmtB family transcription factor [Paracoccaceae bacterium]
MEQLETFRLLGDETRIRALALMSDEQELCVCELVAALEISQPRISRHLAALREAGLLESRRDAQWVFYRINRMLPDWQKTVIKAALAGVADEPVLKQDKIRLAKMDSRPARSAAA